MASHAGGQMKSSLMLNPLSCRSTSLPGNIVLMVKLIVVGLLMKDYFHDLSDHFLPFFPFFDQMGSPETFKRALQFFFVLGSVGVLFSRWIRASCLILGLVFLTAVLSSKFMYTNVKFFCASIFLLTSLSNTKDPLVFLRFQMVIVYFGATVNKIFDPDWRSGQYFEHWMSAILKRETYVHATTFFPPMLLSKIMCWMSICTEFFLTIGFLLKPLRYVTIFVGVYFHSMVFLLASYDFRVFTIAILSSYLMLVRWPETFTVRYNTQKPLHQALKTIVSLVDWDKRIVWTAHKAKFQLTAFEKDVYGFIAFKRLIFYTPFFYFLFAVILGLPNTPYLWLKLKAVQAALVFFFPWPEVLECLREKFKRKR
jgi:hypothetical protein